MQDTDRSIELAGLCGTERPAAGPRVLWLHGYTLDSSSWADLWRRLPGVHHFAADLPGHGQSPLLGSDENLQTLGERLGRACREHEIRHLVAVSYGTMTALQIAIEQPAWFESILLGAPAISGGPRDPRVERTYMQLAALYHQGKVGAEMADLWMSCPAWEGIDRKPELAARLRPLVIRHRWSELQSFQASLRLTTPPQSTEKLSKIESPVRVLIGEREMPAFRQTAELLQTHLSQCTVKVLPDVGHLCLLEAPDVSAREIGEQIGTPAVAPLAEEDH